jgi:hypothetical protein
MRDVFCFVLSNRTACHSQHLYAYVSSSDDDAVHDYQSALYILQRIKYFKIIVSSEEIPSRAVP